MSNNQSQSALLELRNEILRGELKAGQKLRASHLADEMTSSRTPIKEALIALEAEGLLIADKSGYSVRSFNIDDVYASIDIRGLMEAAAVQKAAEIGVSASKIVRLRDLILAMDEIIKTQTLEDYDELNDTFHREVVECSNSRLIIDEVERSYRFPFAAPSAFPNSDRTAAQFVSSLAIGQAHHSTIVDAIEAREGARAFAIMREHARLAYGNIQEALANQPNLPQLALVRS